MNRIRFLLFLLVFVCKTNAQTSGNPENALLWKISGSNLAKPSYLMGTYHLMGRHFVDTIVAVNKAIECTDALVTEVVIGDGLEEIAGGLMKPDSSWVKWISPEDYQLLRRYVNEVTKQELDKFHVIQPIFIAQMIIRQIAEKAFPAYMTDGLPMDFYFMQEGNKQKKTLRGLETIREQMSLLYDSISVKRQTEQLLQMAKDSSSTRRNIVKMTQCYLAHDLNCLMQLDTASFSQAEMQLLLYNRNEKWMRILPGMIASQSCFIAVGALHLPGQLGLIARLRKLGYKIEPVY